MLEQAKHNWKVVVAVVLFAGIATFLLLTGSAADDDIAVDFNTGAYVVDDPTASGGKAFVFGENSGAPASYEANLARIKAQTFRNTNEDNSQFLNTPSAQLPIQNGSPLIEDDSSIYDRHTGSYGSSEFYQDTLFPGSASGPNGATFRANCEVSHFAYDDPMIHPGKPEKAHLHMFMGNTDVNAYSTYDTLLNSGGSTCNGNELNRTAYWIPAMFDGRGNVVVPFNAKFYYKTEWNAFPGRISTYPDNLQLFANSRNNNAFNIDTAAFRCNNIWNGGKHSPGNSIPTCNANNNGFAGVLEYQIFFDSCWNGIEAEAGDWQANFNTNFTTPIGGFFGFNCPGSHPIQMPSLVTHIFFDIPAGTDTSTWHLSSDIDPATDQLSGPRGATVHADWFGAWNKDINQEWVDNCSNVPGASCGEGYLTSARFNNNARALVLRQDWDAGQISPIPLEQIYNQMCSQSTVRPYSSANGGKMAAYCQPNL